MRQGHRGSRVQAGAGLTQHMKMASVPTEGTVEPVGLASARNAPATVSEEITALAKTCSAKYTRRKRRATTTSKAAMITKAQALTMAPFLMCSVSMVPGLCIAAWAVVMRLQIASIAVGGAVPQGSALRVMTAKAGRGDYPADKGRARYLSTCAEQEAGQSRAMPSQARPSQGSM